MNIRPITKKSFITIIMSSKTKVYRSFASRNRRDLMINRDPCINYVTVNQPKRRTAYVLHEDMGSPLCDRIMYRRWYRFGGGTGGKMPEKCVEENHCGTHYPIWMNGKDTNIIQTK